MKMSKLPASTTTKKGGELKAMDLGLGATSPAYSAIPVNTTAQIIPLNKTQAGSGFYQRIGRKIEMTSIEFTAVFGETRNVVSGSTNGDFCRMMLIYDRQPNGAVPAAADVLAMVDQSGNPVNNAVAGINLNNRDRFSVIMDKRIALPAITGDASGIPTRGTGGYQASKKDHYPIIYEYRKLGGLVTHYKADTGAIGDIATGALLLYVQGGIAAGGEAFNIPSWQSRLRYKDV